jgi:hypothetical protein
MPLYSDFKSAKIVKFENVAISKFEKHLSFFRSSTFCFLSRWVLLYAVSFNAWEALKGCRFHQGYKRRFYFQNFVPLARNIKRNDLK